MPLARYLSMLREWSWNYVEQNLMRYINSDMCMLKFTHKHMFTHESSCGFVDIKTEIIWFPENQRNTGAEDRVHNKYHPKY